jgi:hypothetical protein
VISISWGFPDDYSQIKDALVDAHSKNIIILAAAANHGKIDQIAFPARLRDHVICIGAATGTGMTTAFTAEDPLFQSFMAPGKGVHGASIRRTSWGKGYTTERKDGTSSATPIAAGVTALFLEYTHRNGFGEAGTHENMVKLFSAMSAETGDTYRLLRPWTLLDGEKVKAALERRKTEVESCIIVEKNDNRPTLRIIKGPSNRYLILIIDVDSQVHVLRERMDGTSFSAITDIAQSRKNKSCLSGFPLTIIILR